MATTLFSLSKLFTDRFYRVPDYQRGYAWTEKQLQDFWSDLSALEDGHKHYAGVITLEEVPKDRWRAWAEDSWLVKTRGYEPFYVVDGQQRLTTALILIQCFIESVSEVNGRINLMPVKDIRRRFIAESADRITASYLFGYDTGNHSHRFLTDVIFTNQPARRGLEETAYTANLEFAKTYFLEKIKQLSQSDKDRIFKALAHQLHFNVFEIEEEVDVHVAFESMNNRGKPLSHLELLKNRLIYLTTKLSSTSTVSDVTRLRSKINEAWRSIYYHLGKNKKRLLDDDQFLFTQSVLYFGSHYTKNFDNPDAYYRFGRLFRTGYSASILEEIFTVQNLKLGTSTASSKHSDNSAGYLGYPLDIRRINDYVTDLQKSVEIWFDLLNPLLSTLSSEEQLWLERLTRMNARFHLPLILAVFSREADVKARVQLLKAVERHYFFISVISPGYLSSDIQTSPMLIEFLKGKLAVEKLHQRLTEEADSIESGKVLENALRQLAQGPRGFYGWPGLRYFLYEYEQELRKQTKAERSKISWAELLEPPQDHISIEHIFPQKATDAYWLDRFDSITSKKRTLLLGALGNLLALSRPKNSSLQNKAFPEKKGGNEKLIGYKYGSLSENRVAEVTDWTPEAIVNRTLELLNFLSTRWNVNLGDQARRLKVVGLDKL